MPDRLKLTALVILVMLLAGLFLGAGLNADNYHYFLSRRLPKVLAMMLAGIAIATSTLVFQTITSNRILTPSIMGFDALYLLTQVLIVFFFGSLSAYLLNPFLNFFLSTCVMVGFSLVLFGLYFRRTKAQLMTLLLIGLILGQLFGNVSAFFIMLMDPSEFSALQSSLFASFNNINVSLIYWCSPLLVIASYLLYRFSKTLDVFWLDKDNATSLGIDVNQVSKQVFILCALLVSVSTVLIGPILFFGLLMSNLTREFFSTYRHQILLPASALMAVVALLSGQWVIENLLNFTTTLSTVINFIGGVYFLGMLLRSKVI